jgi:hypothetical protein
MKPNSLLFVAFLFFDFAALAWGAWELWSVKKDKHVLPEPPTATTGDSPELSGHPEG